MRYFLALSALLLTSCGFTAEEIEANRKARELKFRMQDEATCASYGFKEGTDSFALCMQQESNTRKQIRAAAAAAAEEARLAEKRAARRAEYGY